MRITKTIQLSELAYELQILPQRITATADQALNLPKVLAIAKANCPTRTGALRESIRVERPDNQTAKLKAGGTTYTNPETGKPVDYAGHVHDGTSRNPPRPFLAEALQSQRDQIANELLGATP